MGGLILGIVVVVLIVLIAFKSVHSIGALEVGLVSKRFGFKKLKDDDPVAYHGEAGYQAALLMLLLFALVHRGLVAAGLRAPLS